MSEWCMARFEWVFPARAGMIRARKDGENDLHGIPRESGDDPGGCQVTILGT